MSKTKSPSDKDLILALDRQWGDAASSGRLADVVALYAKDGSLVWPDAKPVHGKAAIRKAWVGMFKEFPGLRLRFTAKTIHISASGDLASDFGVVELSGDNQPLMKAKYLVVWRKEGGVWKVLYDSWNTNSAPPAPAAAAAPAKAPKGKSK